jgi:CyaY protein
MTSESEFVASTGLVLHAIGTALDATIDGDDADLDWALNDGVLTIDCGAQGKLIVNRHLPNREIWIAARSGGFHFRADGGVWRDTRSGEELGAALSRLLKLQASIGVALPPLAAPLTE